MCCLRIAAGWKDYELLDASSGNRLERWGDIILVRPDPQVVWNSPQQHPAWKSCHAQYIRSSSGGGAWERRRPVPDSWTIQYRLDGGCNLSFALKPMGFKHTGLFPEQAVNWNMLSALISLNTASRPVSVLNLFGYTGAATLACAAAGASVTHVDAAKGMVAWGRDNAALSKLEDKPVRWLIDDCVKFVQREQRRGSKYDIIIMDPPSYGRGPRGETWKIEEQIYPLIQECANVLSDSPLCFLVNSYTTGLSPSTMGYMLDLIVSARFGGSVHADEIGLPVSGTERVLPCGSSAVWTK